MFCRGTPSRIGLLRFWLRLDLLLLRLFVARRSHFDRRIAAIVNATLGAALTHGRAERREGAGEREEREARCTERERPEESERARGEDEGLSTSQHISVP